MIRAELRHLSDWGEHHKHLIARISMALLLTAIVDVIGAIVIWRLERHAQGSEVHSLGDGFFFSTVQLLTVSSQLKNPVTAGGRILDVALEIWALGVVAALAGSFSSFFSAADRRGR